MTSLIMPLLLWGLSAIHRVWRHLYGASLPVLTGCVQFTAACKTFYGESLQGQIFMLGMHKHEQAPGTLMSSPLVRQQAQSLCTWSTGSVLHSGACRRASALRSSLCSYCQAVCLALEEGVPFSNMHKWTMCAPHSPGLRYSLRTH